MFIPFFMHNSKSLPSLFAHLLFFKERLEWFAHSRSLQKSDREGFAQVAHDNRATVNDLLRSLMKKERREQFALFHEPIALFLLFHSQKSSQTLEKPMSKFPTLLCAYIPKKIND